MGSLPLAFVLKKQKILEALSRPRDEYTDSSPKGSVDEGIRELIDLVNSVDGLITTSSCAGRITVFYEGEKPIDGDEEPGSSAKSKVPGGKGGGKWLYVSHDPIRSDGRQFMQDFGLTDVCGGQRYEETYGGTLDAGTRFIKLQFEPMILHVAAASLSHAQIVLSAAMNAGMRESGIQSTKGGSTNSFPVVAVRSIGLALSSVIGFVCKSEDPEQHTLVSEAYLRTMVMLANARFEANAKRIARFKSWLESQLSQNQTTWEEGAIRSARKRMEGLKQQQDLRAAPSPAPSAAAECPQYDKHGTVDVARLFGEQEE